MIKTNHKPKLALCLALSLCGGLFGCSTATDSPVGVRLMGHASLNDQSWPFEIVMEGFDRYYRLETYPQPKRLVPESKWVNPLRVTVAIDDAGDSKDRAYVGRRLWQGDKFRGVAANELRELVEYGHATEEFLTPISREHFPLPCVIKWTDNTSSMPNKTVVYTIEKVKFTNLRQPAFFADMRRKYFAEVNRASIPASSWHEQPSPAQVIATNTLQEARQNPDAAIAKLREAKAQYPLDQPLGGWNQSVLEGALWQVRGLAEKDELLDLFYRALPLAPSDGNTSHGDLDHGPLCLLRAIDAAKRPETAKLLAAIMADSRFDQTDAATIVQMMEMSSEGFPVPKEILLNDERLPKWPLELARALGPKSPLLPLWRNVLRRHYGLQERGVISRDK